MKKLIPYPFLYAGSLVFSAIVLASPLRAEDTMTLPTQAVHIRHLHYLNGKKPNVPELLAPPPLPGSAEQEADLDEVRAVYHAAPANDIAIAYSQKNFSAFTFAPAIGAFFQSNNLPKTTAFFEKVQSDAAAVTDNAKDFYKRPRPYTTDPSLANGKLEKSFSYPSGHSTESMVLALVLADLFPDKQRRHHRRSAEHWLASRHDCPPLSHRYLRRTRAGTGHRQANGEKPRVSKGFCPSPGGNSRCGPIRKQLAQPPPWRRAPR